MTLLLGLLLTLPAYAFHEQILWERAGGGPHSGLGCVILPLGDQNHDGYTDWAVHSCGEHDTSDSPGMTEFFHGGNPPSTTPYMVLRRSEGTRLLMVSYNAGDVNGDGYEDWLTYDNFVAGCSLVRLHYGGPDTRVDSNVVFRIAFDNLSWERVTPIGDFNGDGFGDLLLTDGTNHRASIFYGGSPMDTVADWSRETYLGYCTPGDLNGDGFGDFVSSAYSSYLEIYLGGSSPDTLPALHWLQGHDEIVAVADLNGDGYDDIASPEVNAGVIYFGGPTLDIMPDATLTFPAGGSGPFHCATAGDFNDDGYHDLMMWAENVAENDAGLFTLHLGHPWLNPAPAIVIEGWTPPWNLIGIKVAVGLGDVNGDGVGDIAVGASWDLPAEGRRGKAIVFAGSRAYVAPAEVLRPELPNELALTAYPNPFNSTTEIRYAVPRTSRVSLKVFDVTGREVGCLVDAVVGAGTGRVAWQAEGVASGVYFVRLATEEMRVTRKVLLVR